MYLCVCVFTCLQVLVCAPPYRHLLRLVQQATGWLDGARSGGKPVCQHSGESTDAEQRGGRQGVKEMTKLVHLWYPQAAHHLLGLYLLHQVGT